MFLLDLADVCRTSGLKVIEVPGWRTLGRPASSGGFAPRGVLNHHTGAKDTNPLSIADDFAYAEWLAKVGRSDLSAPLCQVSLSRRCIVYVCAAGRGNHAGRARARGPMPGGDGNELYLGNEIQNDGSEGWGSRGHDAAGREITQWEAAVRLNAALCGGYGWDHTTAAGHKETSVTGKWDPGLMDMDLFRADLARAMSTTEDDMAYSDWPQADKDELVKDVARAVLETEVGNGMSVRQNIRRAGDTKSLALEVAKAMRTGKGQ